MDKTRLWEDFKKAVVGKKIVFSLAVLALVIYVLIALKVNAFQYYLTLAEAILLLVLWNVYSWRKWLVCFE